ncbi:uncharacterized protein Tco025E_10142, partial [Trypanosoma conorhini]
RGFRRVPCSARCRSSLPRTAPGEELVSIPNLELAFSTDDLTAITRITERARGAMECTLRKELGSAKMGRAEQIRSPAPRRQSARCFGTALTDSRELHAGEARLSQDCLPRLLGRF